ncbi:2OG-Fe(II) oxygenase [Achromobacter sp. Marseille-Q0513]|uniref:2OG-Fe(II) oxygenase n=1 Tax=Achromobacter sp. Marseille-Q0513 TaxID=2829161 RepID=UPI001B927E7D|nr:2OG-Fe(II) oxygenase [Achromobacter sp. Marseille-Q0513]MBR8657479.1 2OG-Fe(II) oxygenase [Achromobacter sp. Marseille-Q0513]
MTNQEQYTQIILQRLDEAETDLRSQWANPVSTRTRHFVLDNVFSEALCAQIYDAFPKDGNGFYDRATFREKKRTSADLKAYAAILGDVTHAYQDPRVVSRIADICDMADQKIEPDPKLYAGGLSMMFQGDFLNPHIDNSHDSSRERYRRLNILYYPAPDWSLENGGNFELWNDDQTVPKTLVSLTNRLVVMETNKDSWHSVSKVVVDRPRCCVSNYYFSSISPDSTDYFHVTSFTGRPEETVKRTLGAVDNALRNFVSKTLKTGRGTSLMNKDENR